MAQQNRLKNVPQAQFVSQEDRSQLTRMIMRLLSRWELSTKEQLALLGLSENSRYMLQKYKSLNSVIPYEKDKLDRASLLLIIHERLATLFPENEALRYGWVKRANAMLNNKRPIDIIMHQGLVGLAKMMRFLDFQMAH